MRKWITLASLGACALAACSPSPPPSAPTAEVVHARWGEKVIISDVSGDPIIGMSEVSLAADQCDDTDLGTIRLAAFEAILDPTLPEAGLDISDFYFTMPSGDKVDALQPLAAVPVGSTCRTSGQILAVPAAATRIGYRPALTAGVEWPLPATE